MAFQLQTGCDAAWGCAGHESGLPLRSTHGISHARDVGRRAARPDRGQRPRRRRQVWSSTAKRACATRASAAPCGRRRSSVSEDVVEAARWLIWEASQTAWRAIGEHPRPVHGARPGRGQGLHRAGGQPAHPGLRHGRGDVPRGRGARRRHDRLRAGAERAGVHVPAARRIHHQRPGRLHRRRLARPGVRPGRPLPVQRREVRDRPRRHGRSDPPRDARRDRGRLRQHRHRLVDAGRPRRSRRSRTSSARTSSARPRSRRSSARWSPPTRR